MLEKEKALLMVMDNPRTFVAAIQAVLTNPHLSLREELSKVFRFSEKQLDYVLSQPIGMFDLNSFDRNRQLEKVEALERKV